jgi:chaperonin GroEL
MPKPKVIGQPKTTEHFTLGINVMADLLAPTLGPIGGIVANQRDVNNKPELLDDSATAMRRILNLGDPRMDVGAMLMRSMVWRVVQRAGDGGATAAVLARAMYREAMRMSASGINVMRLSKGIELGVARAVAALKAQARPVAGEDELAKVALTVIREPDLAAVLGEMSYLLGADAHVSIEKYVAPYLHRAYHQGANYRAQIASMYLYTDPVRKTAVLPAGAIALVDGKLDQLDQIVAILDSALKTDAKSLTVVAGSFSDEVIGVMVRNSRGAANSKNGNAEKDKARKLTITGVKFKDVGDARREAYDDLAMLTGASVLGRAWSKPVEMAGPEDLGRVVRAEFGGELLTVAPERLSPDVQEKAAELRTKLARTTLDDEARPLLVKRLSAMTGGMGVLKIGTDSKLDREVMAQNAERALKVLSAAQHGGVAPGGGAAFLHCIPALADVEAEEDAAFGVEIVRRALAEPIRVILENAHVPSSSVIMDQVEQAGPSATYDVLDKRVVDAYEAGILDVADVLSTVLRTASSGALMALTTDTIVYHKNPEQAFTP